MMRFFLSISLLVMNISWSMASANPEADSKQAAKAIMNGVYESFIKIIPYVYSDQSSIDALKKDPVKKAELIKNLTDISDFFKGARHVEYFQRPGFKPTLESMNYHLTDTINSVTSNNFVFAQKRMNVLTTFCISCHSQLSAQGSQNAFSTSINKAKREDFISDFSFANYLYLVRQFEDSEKYFDLALEKALNESASHELYSSLRKVISIHTKVDFNAKKANAFVDKYLGNPKLPVLAKNILTSWHVSLKKWNNFEPKKIKSIEEFIKTYLSPLEEIKEHTASGDNDITLLVASGVLSKYLNDNPKSKLAPQVLYWLSIAEKRLGNTYFFTLSELYLKECIQLYPQSVFAKKCYNLYEENIQFGYSGSGGTDIPPEEKKEMARLKSFLK